MIALWYIAVEIFSPSWGDRWINYVEWSGLSQLEEVVSLDSLLCPGVIKELKDEDWNHNVHEDFLLDFFYDLEYLEKRIEGIERACILAVLRNPFTECQDSFSHPDFRFQGYDLVGMATGGMSALTNCGGFPLAFRNDELSCKGLISELSRALEVQAALLKHYPDESHAKCDIWALWRKE